MGLMDNLKEMKEQLAELEKEDVKEPEVEETVEEPEKPEEKQEDKPEEKPEIKEPDEDKHPARLRREAAAQKRRAEEAEARLAELQKKPEPKEEAESQEDFKLPPVMQEIVQNHVTSSAEREFQIHEMDAQRKHNDFAEVAGAYAQSVYQSYKMLNPDASQIELHEMTKQRLLSQAAGYLKSGYDNPAEEMYLRAKEMGFKAAPKEEPKTEKVADMAKVAANRARNAGTASAKGATTDGQMTASALSGLSVREMMKIPKAERDKILRRGK